MSQDIKPLLEDDILIRRVANGFLVKTVRENIVLSFVYEDTETDYGEQEALINFLFDHYAYLFQSKRRGGLHITIKKEGYEEEP